MNPTAEEGLLAKLKEMRLQLETLRRNGYDDLEGEPPKEWVEKLRDAATQQLSQASQVSAVSVVEPAAPAPTQTCGATQENEEDMATSKERQLKKIATQIAGCTACPLAETRLNTVPGVGNPDARILFIGEAPGASEDKEGEPFVGRAGKLLTDMIGAMGFSRDDIYIANILKCRPPGNRDPLPAEVELCEPFLKQQIALIKPEVICTLGRIAAQTLLRTETPIGKLRGAFHEYEGIPLLPTYHPAYLLRNPAAKGDTWADLKMILHHLGLPVPKKR